MMTHSDDTPWFLVQTKPNAHEIAARNLRRQGLRTFLPLHETTGRKASRFVSRLRPLFPGYLFVQAPAGEPPWRSVNGTLGVSRVVSFGSKPRPVPAELVEALRARCDTDGRLRAPAELAQGDDVEILQGPFANFVATVEDIDPDRRVWLLLDLMGQKTRVSVDPDHLAKRG